MRTLNILVADASSEIRRQVTRAFSHARTGLGVVEASDGPEALKALQTCSFDVVLISRSLPRFDGRAFLEWEHANRKRTLVVLLTDKLLAGWPKIATQIHAYDVLRTPCRDDIVAKLLDAYNRMQRSTKVLLVGGSQQVLTVTSKLLERSRFALDVTESDTAAFALKAVTLETFDIALISTSLSDTNGLEAIVRMSAKAPGTRFILMGTGPEEGVAAGLRRFGIAAYLRMPFELCDLEGALHDALGLWRPYLLNALRGPKAPPRPAAPAKPDTAAIPEPGPEREEPVMSTISAPLPSLESDPNSILFDLCYEDGATARLRIDRAALRAGDHLLGGIIRDRQVAGQIPSGRICEVKRLISPALLD